VVAKILIKRKIPQGLQSQLLPVLTQLRQKAVSQPGYISGETLRSLEDPEDYLIISTWQSVDNWKQWWASPERKELQDKLEDLLPGPTEYEFYQLE